MKNDSLKALAQRSEGSLPDSASKTPKKQQSVHYYRMKRKGNGWVLEKATIQGQKVTLSEVGDWDLRATTEQKLLAWASKDPEIKE